MSSAIGQHHLRQSTLQMDLHLQAGVSYLGHLTQPSVMLPETASSVIGRPPLVPSVSSLLSIVDLGTTIDSGTTSPGCGDMCVHKLQRCTGPSQQECGIPQDSVTWHKCFKSTLYSVYSREVFANSAKPHYYVLRLKCTLGKCLPIRAKPHSCVQFS